MLRKESNIQKYLAFVLTKISRNVNLDIFICMTGLLRNHFYGEVFKTGLLAIFLCYGAILVEPHDLSWQREGFQDLRISLHCSCRVK
jgi:hypothetical protein